MKFKSVSMHEMIKWHPDLATYLATGGGSIIIHFESGARNKLFPAKIETQQSKYSILLLKIDFEAETELKKLKNGSHFRYKEGDRSSWRAT